MASPDCLTVSSLNCRGFNTPEKRRQIVFHFHKLRTQILLLQETHFRSDSVPQLSHKHYPTWYHSTNPSAKSRGVSIAFHASFSPNVLDSYVDPAGRFIFLKLSYKNLIYTVANVYSPNQDQLQFFSSVTSRLKKFSTTNMILGGDFNVALLPRLDSSTGKSSHSLASLTKLRSIFTDLSLVDAWRVLHPSDRDYTYYSPAHSTYSRLDYILISQSLLDLSPTASIGLTLWSDHAPVHVTLGRISSHKPRSSWRLNDNLLSDLACTEDIIQSISHFISDHAQDDTNPLIKWEALKCVLRGKFIQHGSRLKKARAADVTRLLAKITSLEDSHKRSPDQTTLVDLAGARRDLMQIFAERSLVARDKGRFTHYSQANKCGRLLANTLQPRLSRKHISVIVSPNKGKLQTNSAIAEEFRQYYADLYDLPPPDACVSPRTPMSLQGSYPHTLEKRPFRLSPPPPLRNWSPLSRLRTFSS